MVKMLLIATLLSCSGSRRALGTQKLCGLKLTTSTWLTEAALREAVEATVYEATKTDDYRLKNIDGNCSMLSGYSILVRGEKTWEMLSNDGTFTQSVSGATYCQQQRIEIGAPRAQQGWKSTSLVHEFFHAMQDCVSPPPTDVDRDDDHSNWTRDGIGQAILRAEGWR